MIGAHPDDEDTGLLVLLSRGRGADAAYLSLTRGEGGQNLIGDELGIALGILRTRELEAARAIDGARQYFTRAYDFGYTRSLAETERFWPPDTILKDVVRIVRRFRPHVIVSVFSGTPRDGHGQHQMAGVMAQRAYELAGDPAAYPELATEDALEPWTPLKLYRSTRFDSAATTLTLALGGIDPRVGKTYRQIAAESRSQHRSQDFGSTQPLGPASARLQLMDTRVPAPPEADLFAGIPAEGGILATVADSLRRRVSAATMDAAVPVLGAALARAGGIDPAALLDARSWSAADDAAVSAAAVAAGLSADVRVATPTLVEGQPVTLEVELYNGGPFAAQEVGAGVWTASGTGWRPRAPEVGPGELFAADTNIVVAPGLGLEQPYYLRCGPPRNGLYDWSCVSPADRGSPMGFPPARSAVVCAGRIAGAVACAVREPTYRRRDQALGEIREPVRVVPRIDVRLTPAQVVWPSAGSAEHVFTATVRNNGADTAVVALRLEIEGWAGPPGTSLRLPPERSREVAFRVRRPPGVARARVTARAVARTDDGRTFSRHAEMVDYPHVRATQWLQDATSEIVVAPIALPAVGRVGYVRGAADRVPQALEDIGLPLELIGPDTLARGDLSRFAVIVIGSRAYETDTALTAHNDRLLAWVREGGHLIVQYQQYAFVRGGYAPYRLSIGFPHDRITDETAPVRLLDPDHPVFRSPNDIGPADWEGWVQERGLYFPGEWAPEYRPLLEMKDPDRPPYRGGLLAARYGKGTYVYTGISFFRELPAGVPGAFRLFLNLLAWDGSPGD